MSGAQINLLEEIIVDNFAGGGGASTGIELATGRPVTIAINHDPDAILMHKTNHPFTEHYQASVWDVDPCEVAKGRPVGLAWFSPDCKHFSKAKGGKPVDKNIRGLAWIVLRWAGTVRPRVIILENVEEFQTWGPVRRGRPVKSKAGQTFHKWLSQLQALGYAVEWRELVAADYGAPTTRKRFFLVARCDGAPIVWTESTHAPADSLEALEGRKKPWRSAAEIIDWSLPCPSIFDTREQIREKYGLSAQRPLRPNTMRRVIRGVDKFAIKNPEPFLVVVNHAGDFRGQDAAAPLQTVTAKHGYGVASPVMAPLTMHNNENATGTGITEPVNTITSSGAGGHQMVITPTLAAIGQTGGGERGRKITEPTHTQVSKAEECVVAPALIQYHTEQTERVRGQGVADPLMTIDASNRYGLAAASLVKYYGSDQHGQGIGDPLHTVTAKDREAVLAAHITEYHGASIGTRAGEPAATTLGNDHQGLVATHMVKMKGTNLGGPMSEPVQTITAGGGHFGVVTTVVARAEPGAELGHWPEIRDVLDACQRAPQHRYLFLTKNPARYLELDQVALLPHAENFWYGSTVANEDAAAMYPMPWVNINTFWSMEPLLGPVDMSAAEGLPQWVILGAETGSRPDKVTPRREWVDQIAEFCAENEIPVFYKDNLRAHFQDLPPSASPWEV